MLDISRERTLFITQTANLDIFKRPRAETYYEFRLFQVAAIESLSHHFDEACSKWAKNARKTLDKSDKNLTQERNIEEIEDYRKANLGLDYFGPDQFGKMDALTTLLRLALEEWPSDPAAESEASIVQGIDEFSSIFIVNFGESESLLRIFKESFKFS